MSIHFEQRKFLIDGFHSKVSLLSVTNPIREALGGFESKKNEKENNNFDLTQLKVMFAPSSQGFPIFEESLVLLLGFFQ